MEDLARIVAIMFGAWIASGVVLAGLAWRAPSRWSRAVRMTVMILLAALFSFLTGALFGIVAGASSLVPAAIAVYLGARQG